MGHTCSSDQSAPLNVGAQPCPRHKMNPQRSCRECQLFMSSRRPEPRGYQFAPRVQQRYPPQVKGQRPLRQPQANRHPYAEGRSFNPQRQGNQMPYRGRDEGPSPQMMPGQSSQFQASPQRILGPSPQMMGGPSQKVIHGASVPSQQMMSHMNMGSSLQGVSNTMPATQPQILNSSVPHIPQQLMATKVFQQEVPMPTIIQAPAPPPCSTQVIVPTSKYEEIVPAQNVVYESVVMPMPKVVTAPAPPPCPTEVTEPRRLPQQAPHGRIKTEFVQHPQPRFQ